MTHKADAEYQALPADALVICKAADAPARLIAHLILVHDTAHHLLAALMHAFPSVSIANHDVLFGAAIHDIGKALHPEELIGPGHLHEAAGRDLLTRLGEPANRARFTWTHAHWQEADATSEDLVVALADNIWRGRRVESLELQLANRIAQDTALNYWDVYLRLDDLLETIAANADARLTWQGSFLL